AVAEIVQLLSVLNNPSQAEQHAQAQQQLGTFQANPQFGLYLAHMMAHPSAQVDEGLRQLAGLVLKNLVKTTFKASYHRTRRLEPQAQAIIRERVLVGARDTSQVLRHTAGSVVTTIVSATRLSEWPELLPALVGMLESGDAGLGDGALNALVKICEDSAEDLNSEELGRPLNQLVPMLLSLFSHPTDTFRVMALTCINSLISLSPQALLLNMDASTFPTRDVSHAQGLSKLATDPNASARKGVCEAMVLLVDVEILLPRMQGICEFMLMAQQDPDPEVSTEAGDFWMVYCDRGEGLEVLVNMLPRLIPVLVACTVYSADQIAEFESLPAVDEHIPDAPEDIRPMFHRARSGGEATWNLRKCAAAAVDNLSTTFGPDRVLPALLPALEERLASADVWQRESAMLALGAASEGCLDGLGPHLPVLFGFLIQQQKAETPQLRSIACWFWRLFARVWIVSQESEEHYLVPVLRGLVERVLDSNKKVQEAACSAMSVMEEEVGYGLQGYLDPILRCFAAALAKYQTRSLIVLYDTIGTLADNAGACLAQPALLAVLMPPLMQRWNQVADDDRTLLPALECLASIVIAVGGALETYIQPIFTRCLKLTENTLVGHAAADQPGYQVEPPEKEFMVCSLDLLSGMSEGLGSGFGTLLASSNLLPILLQCCADESVEVRQSAFAVVGELAKSCMPHLKQALPQFLERLVRNLSDAIELVYVCNNASWAIGEIANAADKEVVAPWVPGIMSRLVDIISKKTTDPKLVENVCITIGRLGSAFPESLAPDLVRYCSDWCEGLTMVRDRGEKEAAFKGLCLVIRHNPSGVLDSLGSFCRAVGSWHDPAPDMNVPPELAEAFKQILQV
ncbi:unnamed protein product, partial [Scytosiphon promiscuus]